MGLNFYARNKQINTANLIFVPNTNQKELNAEGAEQVLTMRAYVDENKYLEFEYKLLRILTWLISTSTRTI